MFATINISQCLAGSWVCGERWDVLPPAAENTGSAWFWRGDKVSFKQIVLHLQKELLKYKQEARNLQGIKVRKGEFHPK